MFKRFYFLSVAAAVAMAATLTAVPAQAQAQKFYPKGTEFTFSVNVRQILDSKLVKDNDILLKLLEKQIAKQIEKSNEAKQVMNALGFDLLRDLDSVTIAGETGKDQKEKVIAIMIGRFNAKKFADAGAEAARQFPEVVRIRRLGGKTVYNVSPPGEDEFYLTLANKNTLLVTPTLKRLQSALAQNGGASANLKTLLKDINSKQSLNFVATKVALEKGVKESGNPQLRNANQFIGGVEGISGSITVGKDIQFQMNVLTKNAQAAREMTTQTQQGLVFLSLMVNQQAQQNPQVAPLVDIVRTLRASAKGSRMTIRGNVPQSVIRQGLDMLKLIGA